MLSSEPTSGGWLGSVQFAFGTVTADTSQIAAVLLAVAAGLVVVGLAIAMINKI